LNAFEFERFIVTAHEDWCALLAFSEIYEDCFLHFRSGGNWQSVLGSSDSAHRQRFDSFVETLGQAAHLCGIG
jgi:hypothetical protein